MQEKLKNRMTAAVRLVCGMGLLALLAFCSFAGRQKAVHPALPVSVQTVSEQAFTLQNIREELEKNRREELALLESVLARPDASAELRENALSQKIQIASSMEEETVCQAALRTMGFSQSAVFSGGQVLSVFVPGEAIREEGAKERILSTLSGLSGTDVRNIKIILLKK